MPKLTMMCGLPRSGKSTWAREHKGNAVIVSADQLRLLTYRQRYWADGEPLVWWIHSIALRSLMEQGIDVIVDETNTTPKKREPLIRMAKEYGYTVDCVVINTPKEECLNRAKSMDDSQIQSVIERMAEAYISPSEGEGFDSIIVIGEPIPKVEKGFDKSIIEQSKELLERAFSYANEFPYSSVAIFSNIADELAYKCRTERFHTRNYVGIIGLANGSVIYFRHIPHRKDLSKFQGHEFDCCIVDKASEYPDEYLEILRDRTKSSKGYPAEFKII